MMTAMSRRSSFALNEDEDALLPPPVPEKESIWDRAAHHLSVPSLQAQGKGRYAQLEQDDVAGGRSAAEIAAGRRTSYVELDMLAQGSPKPGGSRPSSPRIASVFHRGHAVYKRQQVCPDPRLPLPYSLENPHHRSKPLTLPSTSPDFSLSLVYDTAVCNAFELTIKRRDKARCESMERSLEPSKDPDLARWIKENLGPDGFNVQLDGAERRAEEVPTRYLGDCEYLYRFRLGNSGRLWMNVTQTFEDYEAFMEIEAPPGSRPKPALLMRPLVSTPLELNLCTDNCVPFVPPRLGTAPTELFGLAPLSSSAAAKKQARLSSLPACSSLSSTRSPLGHYVPSSMHDLVYPSYHLPSRHSRPSAGLYSFIPSACTRSHDGLRFRDHSSCLEKEHSVFLIGDSHARAVFDIALHRLRGNDSITDRSMKVKNKSAHVGNLYLEFTWDQYLESTIDCDQMRKFDTIAVSTGSHQACFNCPPTSSHMEHLTAFLSSWPATLAKCHERAARPKKPRLVLLNIPATHPQLHSLDCRTGPRIHYWNRRAEEAARENRWEVIDVEAYSKPGAIDVLLGDGIHFLGLDAAEPIVDDFLDRIGICGDRGEHNPPSSVYPIPE
ncbi:hypothetical protein Rhopal_007410-T1 [Rhodotorula paludigena]|uniref:Uncharacterized protein n=1 Tax=Rhodotorula paludigena TaxID=86838 RepID=A0AAV5GP19_9BASI|nr:hypothetical protein Rhopal_007410-T1 [Rhodotorula paludigena]